LKRVFAVEIEKCDEFRDNVKIIASKGTPDVIEKILKHLGLDQAPAPAGKVDWSNPMRRSVS
tara:strand:- start:33 stop:218 length:186 start_codon:yes stop_codon:yes gene_type:complete